MRKRNKGSDPSKMDTECWARHMQNDVGYQMISDHALEEKIYINTTYIDY